MLDQRAQQAGLKETFVYRGVETRLSSELETTCFRVAQEAITNVVRHARATHVRLELQQRDHELCLQVGDDGVGFDSERALSDIPLGQNLGLLGMQERVGLMDGRLTIRSAHGQGTEVKAWFPLPSRPVPRP
jgi:signal transduction histidine kinase